MEFKKLSIFLIFSLYFLFPNFAFSDVPFLLHHQGRILDSNGAPLSGTQQLTFKLYTSNTANKEIYSEAVTVSFQNGYYSVQLGLNSPLKISIFKNTELYLGITVGSGQELKPRIRLLSVPYAILSHTALNLDGGVVNAKELKIQGKTVIDSSGKWLGDKAGLKGEKGDKGDPGASCSIAGQKSDGKGNIVITFKCGNKTSDVTIPRGPQGEKGDKGDPGASCSIAKTRTDNKGNTVITFKCGNKSTDVTVLRGPAGTAKPVSCPSGQAVVKIEQNGNVTCLPLQNSSGFEHGLKNWEGLQGTAQNCKLVSELGPAGTTAVENKLGKPCYLFQKYFQVLDRTKRYVVSAHFRNKLKGTGKGRYFLVVQLLDKDKKNIPGPGGNTYWWYPVYGAFSDLKWHSFAYTFGPGTNKTFPPNAYYIRAGVLLNEGGGNFVYQFQGLSLSKLPGETRAYYFHGAFATPTLWMADVIFNGNYKRFCEAIGKTYVRAATLQAHYSMGRGNGYFYKNWYYVGRRFCRGDKHIYGNGNINSDYNVWQYSGNCGCCVDRTSNSSAVWTFERSALIYCR